ncbi:MAG: FIST signal transduction protein [Myxococcota bacterium]
MLLFGTRALLGDALAALPADVPRARCFGCSSAGHMAGAALLEESVVATFVWFDRARIESAWRPVTPAMAVQELGAALVRDLPREELRHVLVLSDGVLLNGSELVAGINAALPPGVSASGGLAGDDGNWKTTTVICRGELIDSGAVVAVGFYGPLEVGAGALGGWIPFGPSRRVTRSTSNVLSQLDGESALALYKRYLGPFAAELPGSALLFPLELQTASGTVARTVLGVDEAQGTLTFAGDLPEGATVRMMRTNLEKLVDGATGAAVAAKRAQPPVLALLVSCVGRKLVLKQRVEEELDAVREIFGAQTALAGFYSYGEIGPGQTGQCSELHNQSMTVTTLAEVA